MRCVRHTQEVGKGFRVHKIHGPAAHAKEQEQKSHVREQRPDWCEPRQYGAPRWCGVQEWQLRWMENGGCRLQAADCSYRRTGWQEETRRGCTGGKVLPTCRQGLEPLKTTGAYLSLLSAATDNACLQSPVPLPAKADGRPHVPKPKRGHY